jgi:hypothetical protein
MRGIVTSGGRKVPTRLPTVDKAKMRPAVEPALSMSLIPMRMAKGATIPSNSTDGTKRTTQAKNDPSTAPVETESMPWMVTLRKGRATNGMIAVRMAPARTMKPSSRGLGQRSASRPPTT